MKNLFEKGSTDDTAMKSRDKKRAMFVKVITLLELVSKKDLGIDVDKILAGHEAEKTNLMLQIVGRLAGKSDCIANNATTCIFCLQNYGAIGGWKNIRDEKI